MAGARYVVDPWAPEYGLAVEDELTRSHQVVHFDVEVPTAQWGPVTASTSRAVTGPVAFLDGVRQVDANLWVASSENPGRDTRGLCGSYAAGVVLTGQQGRARVMEAVVARCLVTCDPEAQDVVTSLGRWTVKLVGDDAPTTLSVGLQSRMAELEAELATRWSEQAELCINDGPLNRVGMPPGAVGYVKTHHTQYLDDDLLPVIADLRPGERTPLFCIVSEKRALWSWYLRHPGPRSHLWAGVVRCEVAAGGGGLEIRDAIALAEATTATLPRYASSPHRDPRAPQNLIPVGGLEVQLRHRLGERDLLLRSLRRATH